jgi:hypothetical protein
VDLTSFLDNVVAGIVSSIMTYLFIYLSRKYRLSSKFSKLSGRYVHCSVDNEPLLNGVTEVKYLGDNVILTKGEFLEGSWQGRISMNETLPEFGSGIYQYTDSGRNDCGIHQIQVAPSKDVIYVLTTNTSHGKNNTSAYIWKKERAS